MIDQMEEKQEELTDELYINRYGYRSVPIVITVNRDPYADRPVTTTYHITDRAKALAKVREIDDEGLEVKVNGKLYESMTDEQVRDTFEIFMTGR